MADAPLSFHLWALPALLAWPLLGAVLVLALGRAPDVEPIADDAGGAGALRLVDARAGGFRDVRNLTLVVLVGELLLAAALWAVFEPARTGWQARVDLPWIPAWGARLTLGIDGLSLVMIGMTALVMPLAVLGSWRNVAVRPVSYHALLLALVAGVMGVFTAIDLLLFYVAWELVLIPMFFMIGMSGGVRRRGASLKYFILTSIGSLLMLAAIVGLWARGGATSFALDALIVNTAGALPASTQLWLFLAFFLAFAIKSGVFPLHGWMPDAQHEAPTSAAVALGIKVGTFGLLRFALPLFPAAALHPTLRTTLVGVAVAGILYAALVAAVQPDLKRLASFASVSHIGFVILGIFALTQQSIQGAMIVMVNHGISMGALFVLIGMLRDRVGGERIERFGGITRAVPMFAAMMTLVALSTVGLPATNGFVGEFLVLLGAFRTHPVAATLATIGVILAAVYMLWSVQRVLFEAPRDGAAATMRDLDGRELGVMAVFAVAILWLGLAPAPVLRRMEGPIARLVEQVQGQSALAAAPGAHDAGAAPGHAGAHP